MKIIGAINIGYHIYPVYFDGNHYYDDKNKKLNKKILKNFTINAIWTGDKSSIREDVVKINNQYKYEYELIIYDGVSLFVYGFGSNKNEARNRCYKQLRKFKRLAK
jgi:hypothetical protein